MTPAFVVAAPASGSGKTIVTLGLLRAFRDQGVAVGSAKIGPDYIDPRFHEAASGRPSLNLDGWAMRRARLASLAAEAGRDADLLIVEGVMGLFDHSAEPGIEGHGGAADVAATIGAPVVLVLDASGMAQSAGAIARGFSDFRPDVRIAGVILNRVASPRHESLLRLGCEPAGVTVFGALPRTAELRTPSRHLGLVQAEELPELERLIASAGRIVAAHVDLAALRGIARASPSPTAGSVGPQIMPLGQRISVAADAAFRFAYPHLLNGWRAAGAEITFFSPLADQAPPQDADAVFLPGGYPELHAGTLASAAHFATGMRAVVNRGAAVYGECGGYMVLGRGLVDAEGVRHAMLDLLGLETSFATRKLHLGYRHATLVSGGALGPTGAAFRSHEFHYATTSSEAGEPLFDVGGGKVGLSSGRVCGSFLHLIDGS